MIREEDVNQALAAVRTIGYTIDSGRMVFESGTPDQHEIHRVVKVEGKEFLQLDLVLVNPVLQCVWESRGVFEWQGGLIPCVSREGLGQMKRLAGRSKDQIDLQELGLADDETSRRQG